MPKKAYTLDRNTVFNFYLDSEKFSKYPKNTPVLIALEEFTIDEFKQLDDKVIAVKGTLLTLVEIDGKFKSTESDITIPILHDKYYESVAVRTPEKYTFEKVLNDLPDNSKQVSANLKVISGSVAEDMWVNHMEIKQNVFTEDNIKYPDIPQRIRIDLELTFKKYNKNQAFKERYDRLNQRFSLLSKELIAKYPNEVQMSNYKGMPIIYLKGNAEYTAGKHRIFITPTSCYSYSNKSYIRKFYDLSNNSIRQGLNNLSKLDTKYFLCPHVIPDCINLVSNLNLRKKLVKN